MLHRAAGTALLITTLLLGGCSSSGKQAQGDAPVVGTEVVSPLPTDETAATGAEAKPPGKHGENWQDEDDAKVVGGFSMFKEAWVYVDGKPMGVLREVELPPLPEVWVDQVEYLDFKAGDPGPHERIYQVRRWRLSDYFESIGVDLKKVKAVALHGGKGVVLLDGKIFRKLKDDILFDLTGNTKLKLRVFLPDAALPHLNTSFDRYAAVSLYVEKPRPSVNEYNDLIIEGVPAQGIPYYGQPLRGGVRVYVDGKLALVIKRNALGDQGRVAPGQDEWSVARLLEAHGVDTAELAALDLIDPNQRTTRVEGAAGLALTFKTDEAAQGAVLMSNGLASNTLMFWSQGKVPGPRVMTPAERDKK